MMNQEMLRSKVNDSGYKLSYLATQLGLSSYGFQRKLSGKSDFKVTEVNKLSSLIGLDNEDREAIFFCSDVEK